MADICVPPDCLNGYDCYWLFFCLFTGIPNLDALHAEYYEDPQRTTKTICTTWCSCCGIAVIYTVIQLLLLYISYIYTLSYYRNFVYSPQSTQLHLLVTQFTYKDSSVASDWIAGLLSLFSCYRIDYTYDTLSLLTDTAMQLYGYAAVCMLLYSVEYTVIHC